mgnify:CR=1 FL=1
MVLTILFRRMKINFQLPRTLDSHKWCEQLIFDLKIIKKITFLILLSKKNKVSALYQHHEQVTDVTEQISEFASVDNIIRQT